MKEQRLNGYELSRMFFDWCFENPELVNPNHIAIYFFAVEHCNRLGWKTKFGFPTQMAMDAIGIKKNQTYIKYFNDLCEWGFFELVQKSKNQWSANIISIRCAIPKNGKALDKAIHKHTAKQNGSKGQSNGQSNSTILKQYNNEQGTIKQDDVFSFDEFWELYDKKVDKVKTKAKFDKLPIVEKSKMKIALPIYLSTIKDKQYQKNPLTYINGQCWNDIEITAPTQNEVKQQPISNVIRF